jgi:IS30 family transposase
MQTKTTYRQLQPEERMTIASMRLARSGVRAMARALGRSPATISLKWRPRWAEIRNRERWHVHGGGRAA